MLHDWARLAASSLMLASTALLLAAAAADLALRRVPNAVPLTLAVVGLGLRLGAGSLLGGLAAAALVFALAAFCWRRGWMGGGDVKLLAAATLTVPPLRAPGLLFAVALAGGGLAALYLLLAAFLRPVGPPGGQPVGPRPGSRRARGGAGPRFHGLDGRSATRPFGLLSRVVRIERWRIGHRAPLPYAAAIAAGALFVLMKQ
jgi:prepilin peptidase CpaA